MKEYPATSRAFKVNGKTYEMHKLTLWLQARIEDENILVTYADVVRDCTDMSDEEIDGLYIDQFEALYGDIIAFTYDTDKKAGNEPKKPSS